MNDIIKTVSADINTITPPIIAAVILAWTVLAVPIVGGVTVPLAISLLLGATQ